MHAQQMLSTHPKAPAGATAEALVRAIEAGFDCAQACTACADACLGEAQVKDLTGCIRLNLDCAEVCRAAGALATRGACADQRLLTRMLEVCGEACRLCAEECERHAEKMEHCRICADACAACADACRDARDALSAQRH